MTSLTLHLAEGRCIEGTARARHARLLRELLSSESSAEDEKALELELLVDFLEKADFRALRGERPELDGRVELTVRVVRDLRGDFTVVAVEEESP